VFGDQMIDRLAQVREVCTEVAQLVSAFTSGHRELAALEKRLVVETRESPDCSLGATQVYSDVDTLVCGSHYRSPFQEVMKFLPEQIAPTTHIL
jgi:hypothetical protein